MYFLAHMYTILKAHEEVLKEESNENINPIIIGSWGPDLGYFTYYSKKLKIFEHSEEPPINFYLENNGKKELFEKGWNIHLLADEQIHSEPFFENNTPMCPIIIRDQGVRKFVRSARVHLGREVGLDLLIYKELLKDEWIKEYIFSKKSYLMEKIEFPGVKRVQKYVYWYINKIIPKTAKRKGFGKVMERIIQYDFYKEKEMQKKSIELLEKTIQIIKEKKFITKITRKQQ